MKANNLTLDKFSTVKNNPLLIAKDVFENFDKEIHLNDLIKRIIRKRRSKYKVKDLNHANVIEEARILQAIGLLVVIGKVGYYQGFIFKS
jgi:hypothetical protein